MVDLTNETTSNSDFNPQLHHSFRARHDSAHPTDFKTNKNFDQLSRQKLMSDHFSHQLPGGPGKHSRDHVSQHMQPLRTKREEIDGFEARLSIENHDSVANGGRYPSNRRPFTSDDQTPRRDHRSSAKFQHINVDMPDNEYLPQHPNGRTVRRQGSPGEDGLFVEEDRDMMYETLSRKRQRADSGYVNGGQSSSRSFQQQPVPMALMTTPTRSSGDRHTSHAHAPSSTSSSQKRRRGERDLNTFGAQARSQLNGPSAFSLTPSRTKTFSDQDVMHALAEIAAFKNQAHTVLNQVIGVAKEFAAREDRIIKEQKAQNDHINKSFRELAAEHKKAIQALHEKDNILVSRLEDVEENSENLELTCGGAYGGPKAIPQKDNSTGLFNLNNIVQQQQGTPTAPLQQRSGASPQQRTPQRPGAAPPQQFPGLSPQQAPGPARGA